MVWNSESQIGSYYSYSPLIHIMSFKSVEMCSSLLPFRIILYFQSCKISIMCSIRFIFLMYRFDFHIFSFSRRRKRVRVRRTRRSHPQRRQRPLLNNRPNNLRILKRNLLPRHRKKSSLHSLKSSRLHRRLPLLNSPRNRMLARRKLRRPPNHRRPRR